MFKKILLLIALLCIGGCGNIPLPVFKWYQDCQEYPDIAFYPLGHKLYTGDIVLKEPGEGAARLPRSECDGSWSMYQLTVTDRRYDVLYVYGGTELAPPFTF